MAWGRKGAGADFAAGLTEGGFGRGFSQCWAWLGGDISPNLDGLFSFFVKKRHFSSGFGIVNGRGGVGCNLMHIFVIFWRFFVIVRHNWPEFPKFGSQIVIKLHFSPGLEIVSCCGDWGCEFCVGFCEDGHSGTSRAYAARSLTLGVPRQTTRGPRREAHAARSLTLGVPRRGDVVAWTYVLTDLIWFCVGHPSPGRYDCTRL